MLRWVPEKHYFSSLLIYFSALVSLVILAVSYILYVQFMEIEKRNIYAYSEESLSQISTTADNMLENAKMAISQILLDKEITRVFYQTETDPLELKRIGDRINLIGSMPFLHSVYLYNSKLDLFYTNQQALINSAGFQDQGIVELLKDFDPSRNLKPITRVIKNSTVFANMDYNVYTFIYTESMGPGSNNSIILNITDTWMINAISAMDKSREGGIFIMDSGGVLVSSIYKDQILSNVSRQEFAQQILQSGDSSGHFIGDVDGTRSLVTYASSDALGWKFVRYTPYEDAMKEINRIRSRTILIALAVLLAGLALAYVTSRRLNRPVEHMTRKLLQQSDAIREHSYKAKQTFLRQLMMTESASFPKGTPKKLAEFGCKLDAEEPVRLLLLKLDRFKEFARQYNSQDQGLLRFGMMNIAAEVMARHTGCETVDAADDHIVILFRDGGDADLEAWAREIQLNIRQHLKLSVTAVFSPAGTRLSELGELYRASREAASYRVFTGWEAVLFAEETAKLETVSYRYPLQKEEQMTDALMLGRMEEARSLCLSILGSTEGCSYRHLHLTMFRLFFAINMVADTLEKASSFGFEVRFHELFAELSELERLEDMKEKFMTLFRHMETRMGEKKNAKYDELMRRIAVIIDSQFMKEDLCLDSIAEVLNMSPVYLGRLIKKYTSKSVTDYINEVRIEKAEAMLRETDKRIAAIAEETGFTSNSYFGRVFKKYKGISPNEYRANARHSTQETEEEE
ncbi:Helix-turn-helix domain-containing protein [Paenibacillus sp. UNCCL117]|uniref:helix-turn-helix domain-containing protein n=1 Tax=unclassified Paenibacillus TaxID=185978 RepID=UPI00088444CB|nr:MULTISPECIES: helix-turn-helix domain-containing protein [unclassified Paenibacillus]SDD03777.1 Helix-turn-helix domain-containing protein [Paenibacillus sp. cl123]SFW32232.1 Helix-turn-helix domain-containing protein [Paenibacillus sp. UNCCL117]